MRYLRRILIQVTTLVMLALAGVTAGVWVRSYDGHEHLGVHREKRFGIGERLEYRAGLFSRGGRLSWASGTRSFPPPYHGPPLPTTESEEWGLWGGDFRFWDGERDADFVLGFGSNGEGLLGSGPAWTEARWGVRSVPYWYLLVLFVLLPVLRMVAWARRWTGRKSRVVLASAYGIWLFYGLAAVVLMPGAPFLLPEVVLVLVGAIVLEFMWGGKVVRRGVCRACGYDLRATPGRCPECGTVVVISTE